ncbi:MAG: hopanoid biosynthesis associated radical SAM protein HpnJ [Pseudomonadota bacterium]
MKLLLLNPPSYADFDGGAGSRYQATREVTSFWYPTWLCFPAGMVKDSLVVDAPAEGLSVAATVAKAKEFDLIAVYTSTASLAYDIKTCERIRQENPAALIGMVGPHPSVLPEETLKAAQAVDFVARREFDHTIRELAEGVSLAAIKGLSYREGGRIQHNPDRAPLEDLDSLPFVTRVYKRDLNIRNYHIPYLLDPYVSVYTGRGCPARYIYCLWPQTFTGHRYRVRSPENVVDEVREAVAMFPESREIFFDDDTFTALPERAERIATLMKPLGITWSCTARVTTSRQTLKIMKDAGLRLVVTGFETGNPEILHNIKKGATLEQARVFARNCKELGIKIHGAFILGLPEESPASIEDSIRFACQIDPDTIQVSLAAPYPGTEFYRLCQENGYFTDTPLVSENGWQMCAVSYPHLSNLEIFQAVERFYKRFYYRPRFMLRAIRKMLTDGQERRRMLREGAQFKNFLLRRKEILKGRQAC